MTDAAGRPAGASWFWGPASHLGLITAVITAVADQASKLWLLLGFDMEAKQRVEIAPFLDLVMVWNKGISYGLFQQEGVLGQWVLLLIKIAAVLFLWVWLARSESRLTALSLGLILGGAIGNAVDRMIHGAVADFVLLHLTTETWSFNWYVFNLADVAIVAGVVGLLYESLVGKSQKRPDPAA
jgi:signal peptidase II